MTAPTIHTDIPREVWINWQEAFHAKTRADQIENKQIPALDEQIAHARAHLDALYKDHADAGREITQLRRTSETHRELVELWCSKHGRDLPEEPAELELNTTRELPPEQVDAARTSNGTGTGTIPVVTPCMTDPPRHDQCTTPGCPCGHHQAEIDALTEEQARIHNALTGGVQTAQETRTDATPDGGEAPGNGPFPGGPDA